MGNYNSNYYNRVNKSGFISKLFGSNKNEISNMETIFRKHLNDYIMDISCEPSSQIKIVLHISDFYDLLKSQYHKSFMQVYEMKLYGLTHFEASEKYIKSDREVPQYLFDIINSELISIIERHMYLKDLASTNFFEACKLANNIKEQMSELDYLEGDDLRVSSEQLVRMINTKRDLVKELTQNGIVIITESDLEDQINKFNNIISKCFKILKRTRHAMTNTKYADQELEVTVAEAVAVEAIVVNDIYYVEPSAPHLFVDIAL